MSRATAYLKSALTRVLGDERFQQLLERSVDRSQTWMGIGAGGDTLSSGERSILNTLRTRCEPPYCVFDVGANQGQFLQLILENLGTADCCIHCFEPAAETFRMLTQSCQDDPRIRLNNLAIGKQEGVANLHYDAFGSGLASLTKRRLDHHNIGFDKSESVSIKTIDSYCDDNSIARIHLLKLDIEGHELDALAGAKGMFARRAVDLVTFEFGGCNIDTRTFFQDFWYFFRDANMSLFRITPTGYLSPITAYTEICEQFRTTNYMALANA